MIPIVGITLCAHTRNGRLWHETPARYAAAVEGGAGAAPVMIPPMGAMEVAVLDRLDGLLLPGGMSNVHPDLYEGGESLTPELHDPARDSTSLPLIREAIARGLPVLAICRGIQELNVALGGTLHQAVHAVPGRFDHRGGPGEIEVRYGPKHEIALTGQLARLLGAERIIVNSVHAQGIDRLAPGLAVEALAPDGTIEAVRVEGAAGFAFGVQWHPEWRYRDSPGSLALFQAFGEACQTYRAGSRRAA